MMRANQFERSTGDATIHPLRLAAFQSNVEHYKDVFIGGNVGGKVVGDHDGDSATLGFCLGLCLGICHGCESRQGDTGRNCERNAKADGRKKFQAVPPVNSGVPGTLGDWYRPTLRYGTLMKARLTGCEGSSLLQINSLPITERLWQKPDTFQLAV